MKALSIWFNALAARERKMVLLCASMVTVALLWWLAIAPALTTLRSTALQHAQLDMQLQSMQEMAAQAAKYKSQRPLSQTEAIRNLEASVKQTLGASSTLVISGDRATLTLKAASAESIALWLGQARANARVVPSDAKLVRSPASAASTPSDNPAWDGVLTLPLPAK